MSAEPAFHGFIENTFDALLLFEACRRGDIPKITRRLQEFEKKAMVLSGAIFVFDEEETGIKRWTDGLSWSPSRTLGNFLVYRELDKKGATKGVVDQSSTQGSMMNNHGSASAYRHDEDQLHSPGSQMNSGRKRSLSDASGSVSKTRERALVGSLTSTFRFRADGLVKKTISLAGLHMIGYYRIEDVTAGHLRSPSSHVELASLQIASCFLSPTLFRVPPLVDLGSDGQLRYKGELDPSASPMLVSRSGSSQGFGTPLIAPLQTRTRSHSPPIPVIHHERDSAPSSPRRATNTHRNRYEPYAGGRISPVTVAAFPSYPFPAQNQTYSPNQTYPAVLPREDYYGPPRDSTSSGLSPAMAGLSSGTMNPNWGSGPQSTTLPRSSMNEHIYQPRQATPLAPNDSLQQQEDQSQHHQQLHHHQQQQQPLHHQQPMLQQQQHNTGNNNDSFTFRAPSRPSPLLSNSPTPSYESFQAPPMQTQYSSSSNSSRYGAPPPSYSQHNRPYGHQSQGSGSSTYSAGSYRDQSHLTPASPRHSPQEYTMLTQPSYPHSNRSSTTSTKLPGYPTSPQQQQANGLVIGEMEGPEQRLGLGLHGIRGKIPSIDSTGRRRVRSGEIGFGSYEGVGEDGGDQDSLRREDMKLSNHTRSSNGVRDQYWDSPVEGWQTGKAEYSEKRRSR